MKRRVLFLAAVAVPGLALAQVSAQLGQVVERTNADTTTGTTTTSYLNAAMCAGGNASLEWNTQPLNGIVFTQRGNYRLLASSRDPATRTAADQGFCDETDITGSGTTSQVFAGQIAGVTANAAVQDLSVSGRAIAIAATEATDQNPDPACAAANEGKVFWICAHWFDQNGTRSGVAVGKFMMQFQKPDAPTNVTASSGENALFVSWTAPSNLTVDHYQITATPPEGSGLSQVFSGEVTATSGVRIGGLENDVAYTVSVVAFSKGGNPSDPGSASATTPKPIEDFWEWYQRDGGTEPGGCATGSAGVFGLAAVAALLALRRRTK